VGIGISVLVTFSSDALILLFYGREFTEAASILTIHVWTGTFVFLGIASGQYLVMENLTRVSLYKTLGGLLLNVALNLVLIPAAGARGAALATLVSQACASYLFDVIHPRSREMFRMKTESLVLGNLLRFIRRPPLNVR
jgi:O-antigen/teichoic acid export membrane protein